MVAKNTLFYLIIVAVALAIVFASTFNAFASVQPGKPALSLSPSEYAPNEPLRGYVNINLTKEPASGLVEAAIHKVTTKVTAQEYEPKRMKLLDFLAGGVNFNCSPRNCGYLSVSSLLESITLDPGENFIIINITGKGFEKVTNLEFDIEGTSSSSYPSSFDFPYSPVAVDLLDDNSIEWLYAEPGEFPGTDTLVSEPGDCYSESNYTGIDATLESGELYCEMKTLSPSKRFMLGADVKIIKEDVLAAAPERLFLYLANLDYSNFSSCPLDTVSNTDDYSLHSCHVNFTLTQPTKLFICISNIVPTRYQIKVETADPKCGFVGKPEKGKAFIADYALYAQPAYFAPFDYSVKLDESSFQIGEKGKILSDYLTAYIDSKFDGNCSEEKGGCIIPIKIVSNSSLDVYSLSFDYTVGVGGGHLKNFSVAKPANITMLQSTVSLEALSLRAPEEGGNYSLELSIAGIVIGSANFSVKPSLLVPIISSVKPRNVSTINILTEFTVSASSPKGNEIVSYSWDFGDGSAPLVTAANKANHTYAHSGIYTLVIKATDSEVLKAEETFAITVGAVSPKEALNATLPAKKAALSSIQSKIKKMPWYSTYGSAVEEALKIGDIGLTIDRIEEEFNTGIKQNKTDDYFVRLKSELDQQKVPLSIEDTLVFEGVEALLDVNKINPESIKALGETYEAEQEEGIKNAIGLWQNENLNIMLSGKTLSASFDDGSSEDIFTIINIKLSPTKQELKNVYFIVDLPSGISYEEVEFAGDYGQESVNGVIGFSFREIASAGETISMALPGKQDSLTMNMFASPIFDELSIEKPLPPVTCGNEVCDKDEGEDYKNCPEDCKPSILKWIIIIVLGGALGIFLIWRFYAAVYDLMQQKKFFKTKKNYTDLLIFISASLSRGTGEKEITENLLKSGWNEGQIGYAMLKAVKARQKLRKEEEEG